MAFNNFIDNYSEEGSDGIILVSSGIDLFLCSFETTVPLEGSEDYSLMTNKKGGYLSALFASTIYIQDGSFINGYGY